MSSFSGYCTICKGEMYYDLDTGIEECVMCGYSYDTGETREVLKKQLEETVAKYVKTCNDCGKEFNINDLTKDNEKYYCKKCR
jgi:uncharacterized Fe-S cluster-containing MiaB family protein